ncbi:MAG: class I SAM-dependent DNA methyltransferase [Candidatus Acidiferrales bacterium]
MPLSWNEIRHRAIAFSKEWSGARSERAEKQTFWNEFFSVFGVRRRAVASFEEPVQKISGQYGYIDLFWPGRVLVEHKSRGGDLGKAESQAFRYIRDLVDEGRNDEIPRYVIVSDFERIALHDLEPEDQRELPLFDNRRVETTEFALADLHQYIHAFAFIPGYKQHKLEEHDPINIKAVEIMGRLHDTLEDGGYSGHQLERFLVRVLFCLFGQDTGIFEPESFTLYLLNRTAEDGSDLGLHLARLFDVLNTPEERRQKNLDELLAAFRYVNGDLFAESLGFADFNREMRSALLACARFDWSRISPAIFGSLFQAVMEPRERRQIGGHYTSERDILKLIRSLFLDELRAEFERAKRTKVELERFHEKVASLRFLDPACGCGNFLVITYRELRSMEIEILKLLFPNKEQELDVQRLSLVDVDAFYGIEISEWPVRIAEVAMWLMDHQMNIRLSEAFGQYFVRLPLKKSPTIVCENALRRKWRDVLPPERCSYILGNPPFVGKHYQNQEQKADMLHVFQGFRNVGDIDYVAAWFYRAAEYIQNTKIEVAFVATNSITQGEQVPLLWGMLFGRFRVKIHFAHRTFAWESEARRKAHVHVVIIGFAIFDTDRKYILDYEPDAEHPTVSEVANISPYLTPGSDVCVTKRQRPLCDVPSMRCGNKPSDGGALILTNAERDELLRKEPHAKKFLRRFTGSEEFINGHMRWCLWLVGASPADLRQLPLVRERLLRVKQFRERSTAAPTREAALTPGRFFFISQPTGGYIAIPEVSSERRRYIPIGILDQSVIASNKLYIIATPSPFLLGVLSSAMHMAWVREVGGRLKSDYQYSGSMVYNTFPWPEPSAKQRAAIKFAAQAVLDARAAFPDASLADLYDPVAMPPNLVKAHSELDRAVDLSYRPQPFQSERQRIEYLFSLYEKLIAPLIAPAKRKRTKTSAKSPADRPMART